MIGKILKTMRKEKGLTQDELAKKTYIGRSTISDYEREKTDISFEDIELISKACGYEVIFIKKEDNTSYLSSNNINRKEL